MSSSSLSPSEVSRGVTPFVRPDGRGHSVAHPIVQVFLVARTEARAMLLSFRTVFFIVIYGIISGGIGAAAIWVDGKTGGRLSGVGAQFEALSQEDKLAAVKNLAEALGSEHLANALLHGDLPPLVYFVLLLSTFAIPFLCLLVGYNRIADDIHSRFARYLLQRVHRGPYLAGKVIGHWIACFFSVVLVHVILVGVGAATDRVELGLLVKGLLGAWVGMALFVLAYVAFSAFWSVVSPASFLALLFGGMSLLVLWFLSFWLQPLKTTWLGQWDTRLFTLEPEAMGVYLGHIALFLGTTYLLWRRRDV
ncbi:MAG: ABC transporter permease subunit [Deltaproteobacteria bacterium]|nr:ABC transporter permease subunit [Deltaproteobacteria bacterium]